MELSDFPHCCGMKIIHSYDDDFPRGTKLTLQDKNCIEVFLKKQLKQFSTIGMIVTAVNSQQREDGLVSVLKKVGFRDLTGEFFNPGHQRYISLWGYEFHKDKRKDVPPKPEKKPVFVEPKKEVLFPKLKKTVRRLTEAQRERHILRKFREVRGW